MSRVTHFEISADDPERAVKFYSEVFGWRIEKWEGPVEYWLASTGEGPGIDGALKRRADPAIGTVNTVDVASIDESMAKVKEEGGEVITPKMTIPGIGYHAYCKDPEGNVFGIMEADESAK
jgi:predicted enzyme related to lactoylglutathione lyase